MPDSSRGDYIQSIAALLSQNGSHDGPPPLPTLLMETVNRGGSSEFPRSLMVGRPVFSVSWVSRYRSQRIFFSRTRRPVPPFERIMVPECEPPFCLFRAWLTEPTSVDPSALLGALLHLRAGGTPSKNLTSRRLSICDSTGTRD